MASQKEIQELREYFTWYLDDSLNASRYDPDIHPDADESRILVSIRVCSEPVIAVVNSYLPDTVVDADHAVNLTEDYLIEVGWLDQSGFDGKEVRVYQ